MMFYWLFSCFELLLWSFSLLSPLLIKRGDTREMIFNPALTKLLLFPFIFKSHHFYSIDFLFHYNFYFLSVFCDGKFGYLSLILWWESASHFPFTKPHLSPFRLLSNYLYTASLILKKSQTKPLLGTLFSLYSRSMLPHKLCFNIKRDGSFLFRPQIFMILRRKTLCFICFTLPVFFLLSLFCLSIVMRDQTGVGCCLGSGVHNWNYVYCRMIAICHFHCVIKQGGNFKCCSLAKCATEQHKLILVD